MAKANMSQVEALHALLTDYYAEQLASGEELSSGTLAAINAFLKNNDVKVDVMENKPMQNITSQLQSLINKQEVLN
jgi:ABC-type Zn uptake system ZnuABC Zn-binding protein ZnuA